MTEWFIIIVVGAFLFWCKVCFWISAQVGILRENLRLKEDPKLIHLDEEGCVLTTASQGPTTRS